MNITLTPNNTGKTRTATITVNSGSEEIVVSVTQKNTNESGGEEGGDSGEEYEWVDYKEMFIIDDGQDYMLSPTGHYIYFKEPGFFQGGKGGEGQRMYLLDCGEMSWKDLSIMKKPAWDKETWVGEVVPCKKGHGYFSAITYRGNLDDSRLARFWVKDYVMKGTEIVGAEIKYHDRDYDDLIYMRKVTGIISLPEGVEMCMPGDNIDMNVELITPIAIENGLRFAIREGGRTVGSGVVIAINED